MDCEGSLFGRRVLIVEDDFFQAFAIRSALVRRGATVIGPVASLEGALDHLSEAANVDAALVDVNLGGEKAFPLVDELVRREIPVLFVTGCDSRAIPFRFQHIPRSEKPAQPTVVAAAAGQLIAERVPTSPVL